MAGSKTLTIIKPGAVTNEYIGPILARINEAGFHIAAMRLLRLNLTQAKNFYAVHKEKPFYESLISFMTSGPVVVAILEKKDAVKEYRKLIGHTDPNKAQPGTIRRMFAESMERNAVHGSDSDANAEIECDFFFSKSERFSNFDPVHF
ncbi:MAG TPA: nucleoside-diphosphate kinase [Bacteroidales bacterium]|jgi:nucleoside-diphosphate kinase|nr:nucleoside-diphosphate kinase [Bacteroidales bacterium]